MTETDRVRVVRFLEAKYGKLPRIPIKFVDTGGNSFFKVKSKRPKITIFTGNGHPVELSLVHELTHFAQYLRARREGVKVVLDEDEAVQNEEDYARLRQETRGPEAGPGPDLREPLPTDD